MKTLLRNKIINYIFSRYAIYALQLINTLILAKVLSPFNFGVWGFIQLIIVYFTHFDFGIPSSFNAVASVHKRSTRFVSYNFNAAFTLVGLICCLVLLSFIIIQVFDYQVGEKYNFDSYICYVLIIIILGYFNKLMMNLFRVYNKLKEITFYQACVPLTICFVYILFKENLIKNLLIGIISANIISLLVFLHQCPLNLKITISRRLLKQIQKSGIFFFIYNTSFYFIFLTTRSIIGAFYEVEEFGLFNFAYSISNVIELSISSFAFLIFPKLLNRFAFLENGEAFLKINFIQSNYRIIVSTLSYFAIAVFPIFISFFPDYKESMGAFNLIVLSNLIYANCFGSPILLISRKRERKIAIYAFIALVLNFCLSLILVYVFQCNYTYVIFGTAVTYVVYVLAINNLSLNELNNSRGFLHLFKFTFPWKESIPLLVGFILIWIDANPLILPFLLILYLVFNFTSIVESKKSFSIIINNSSVIDI